MKLKTAPEDFRVDEETSVRPTQGAHALYRLSKRGIGTPEVIQQVLTQWNLPRHRVAYGGLKDRHAQTTQHVTIYQGPRSNMQERSFLMEYLGQVPHAFSAKDISGNRFDIRLRGIDLSRREELDRRALQSSLIGLVNYFDDQRFGSIGISGDLIGAAWCRADYERALYLALAEANSHDRPRERLQKEILRDHWGNWQMCKDRLDRSHRRSVVTYLVDHPTDFKRAMALVRQDLRGIYIAAFQSWVWNRWLSTIIEQTAWSEALKWIPSRCGPLALAGRPVPADHLALSAPPTPLDHTTLADPAHSDGPAPASEPLTPEESSTRRNGVWAVVERRGLPLPSSRIHEWPAGTLELLESILAPMQLSSRTMRLKYPRDTFFSKGTREVLLRPRNVVSQWDISNGDADQGDWLLKFTLPRGSYATMAIRQWTLMDVEDEVEDELGDEEVPHGTASASPEDEGENGDGV